MFVECIDVHTRFCNHLDVEEKAGYPVPWVCLQFEIVVFPGHTHYFLNALGSSGGG